MTHKDYKTIVTVSDTHCPYQDMRTLSAIKQFLLDFKPDYLVFNGDIIDNYSISAFDKNPSRVQGIQEELDVTNATLRWLLYGLPEYMEKIYTEGNHEDRYNRMLHATPQLFSLRSIAFDQNMDFKKLNIKYIPEVYLHGLLIKHSTSFGKYPATKEIDMEGVCGVSGHSHKNQFISKSSREGHITWVSGGHLCDVKKIDYVKYTPNWQQGFTVSYIKPSEKFIQTILIEISKNKFIFNDKEYSPSKKLIGLYDRILRDVRKGK